MHNPTFNVTIAGSPADVARAAAALDQHDKLVSAARHAIDVLCGSDPPDRLEAWARSIVFRLIEALPAESASRPSP